MQPHHDDCQVWLTLVNRKVNLTNLRRWRSKSRAFCALYKHPQDYLWIDERIGRVPPIHTTGEPRLVCVHRTGLSSGVMVYLS